MLLRAPKLVLHYGMLIDGRQRPQRAIDMTPDCLTPHIMFSKFPATSTTFVPLGRSTWSAYTELRELSSSTTV